MRPPSVKRYAISATPPAAPDCSLVAKIWSAPGAPGPHLTTPGGAWQAFPDAIDSECDLRGRYRSWPSRHRGARRSALGSARNDFAVRPLSRRDIGGGFADCFGCRGRKRLEHGALGHRAFCRGGTAHRTGDRTARLRTERRSFTGRGRRRGIFLPGPIGCGIRQALQALYGRPRRTQRAIVWPPLPTPPDGSPRRSWGSPCSPGSASRDF
jgi:hypothetical protein